jgi:predicted amidophosphoribosyltransferase
MKCPHCQAENREGRKFCTACGQPLQTEMVCPQCRHTNRPTAKFCEECGQPLTATQAPPPTPTPPPIPTSFSNGRCQVKKFLGEGGKKKL